MQENNQNRTYNHTAIPAKDLEASRDFYTKLGLVEFRTWDKPDQQLSAIVMRHPTTGTVIELVYHPDNAKITLPSLTAVLHIGFEVADIESIFAAGNFDIIQPITPGVSVKEFAFIRDPNGFPVELVVQKDADTQLS